MFIAELTIEKTCKWFIGMKIDLEIKQQKAANETVWQ